MLNKLLCRVPAEQKQEYQNMLKHAQPLLLVLKDMIEEDLSKAREVSEKDFDSPSWALHQAYKLGLEKGLTKFLEYGIIGDTKNN